MTHVIRLERFELNGSTQHALVRGPAEAPMLLLVQAGPGLPMIHEADALQARLNLEEHWRVVYWDQRGTGRSPEPGAAPLDGRTLSDDVVALASALCERFGVDAVDVLGFSLGGTLALMAAGREGCNCIRRVVAVGPDIDLQAGELFAWRFAYEEAVRRGHRRALRELRAIGAPPHDTSRRFMTRVKWVSNFGGVAVGSTFIGMFSTLLLRLLRSPHYTLLQVVNALRALPRTQARVLEALRGFSLPALLPSVPVPVTLIQGRLDAVTPPTLAERFIAELDAPRGKRLVWLDDCAHTPHFEAPQAFRSALLEALA